MAACASGAAVLAATGTVVVCGVGLARAARALGDALEPHLERIERASAVLAARSAEGAERSILLRERLDALAESRRRLDTLAWALADARGLLRALRLVRLVR